MSKEDFEESQFGIQKLRAARTLRRLLKPAEIIRAQIVHFPDEDTAQVLTSQLSYRFVRRPVHADLEIGDYVSVLNPGGENSGKIWEIINVLPKTFPVVYDSSTNYDFSVHNTYQSYETYQTYQTYEVYEITAYQTYEVYQTVNVTATYQFTGTFGISLDGNTYELTTGIKGHVRVPQDGEIKKWTILADQTGSIVIDIWRTNFAGFPPSVLDSIVSSNPPEISSAQKAEDDILTGWDKAIVEGDIFGFNVDSVSAISKAVLIVEYEKQ